MSLYISRNSQQGKKTEGKSQYNGVVIIFSTQNKEKAPTAVSYKS